MSAAQSVARRPAARGGEAVGGGRRNLGLALGVIATAQLMVVLDATIVNVALPHIQRALGFSGTGLEWVVNAYALSFGGLLLLGGRAGDLLGLRRVFIAGLVLFSAASLAGGFATSQAWLLAARAVQGAGGALVAPTALALIATTFAEGPARNRAMGVYAAMSGGGAAVGLVAGGLLTTCLSWRWVLLVNVPIGVLTTAVAPLVLPGSARRRGRFDLPGALTGTAGVALLVYGLSNAGTDPRGVSHWGDPKVAASLAAAAVLLAGFVVIEARSKNALMPLRIFASRSRSGAYLIMLLIGTAMIGFFFFLTIFVQTVLGYSALKAGVAFLPFTAMLVVVSGLAGRLVARAGARPLMLAGAAAASGGMYWFSRIGVHTTYTGGLLGPSLVTAAGLGLLFVPLSLVALTRVRDQDSGLASSLLNTGQQIGGAIGLAALGTVAWTAAANSARSQITAAGRSGHALASAPARASIYHHALAAGITRGFLVAGDAVIDHWDLAWTGRGKVKQTYHANPAGPGRRIRLTGQGCPLFRWQTVVLAGGQREGYRAARQRALAGRCAGPNALAGLARGPAGGRVSNRAATTPSAATASVTAARCRTPFQGWAAWDAKTAMATALASARTRTGRAATAQSGSARNRRTSTSGAASIAA
jgi:EmrB/QacA subfamily drug resistance transporter